MSLTPSTIITLYANPNCDITYKNVINYGTSRQKYFERISPSITFNNIMYIRHNGIVDVPLIYDRAHDFNYVVYDNNEGRGYEYAFIERIEFINFSVTRLHLKYDVWTNNYNAIKNNMAKCNIIRQHMNSFSFSELPRLVDSSYDPSRFTSVFLNRNYTNAFTIAITFNYGYEGTAGDTSIRTPHSIYDPSSVLFLSYNHDGTPIGGVSSLNKLKEILTSSRVKSAYVLPIVLTRDDLVTLRIFVDDTLVPITGYSYKMDDLTTGIDVSTFISIDNVSGDDYMIYASPYTKYYLTDDRNIMEIDRVELGEQTTLNFSGKLFFDNSGAYVHYSIPYVYENYNNPYTSFNSTYNIQMPRYISNFSEYIESQGYKDTQTLVQQFTPLIHGNSRTPMSVVGGLLDFGIEKGLQYNHLKHMYPIAINDGSFPKILSSSSQPLDLKILKKELYNSEKEALLCKWNKYGYLVNILDSVSLRTRKYYNYILTSDYTITSISQNDERKQIEDIFNNGVTIWHYIDGEQLKYGNYLSNEVNEVV